MFGFSEFQICLNNLTNFTIIFSWICTIKELLFAKGIFTEDEFIKAVDDIAKKVAKSVLQKAQIQGNLDEIIESINNPTGVKKVKN